MQDWLTLLQFERPDLVYVMSCRYNRQLGRDYQVRVIRLNEGCVIY